MTDAFIYDHVRTPRGRGKKGSLHGIKPVDLVVGLVDEVVGSVEELVPTAKAWILENTKTPEDTVAAATQPWDRKGFRLPGSTANAVAPLAWLRSAPLALMAKHRGLYPAPEAAMSAVVECAGVGVCTSDYGQHKFERLRRPIYPLDAVG